MTATGARQSDSAVRERACVGIGSNLGDRLAAIERAVLAMASLPGTRLVARSSVHETEPVGPVPQGPFLNAAALLVTSLAPGDLLDALLASFPERTEEEEDDNIKIAIVGKPNAGKSSLLNRLVGEERVIVSPIAGTTRDSIDTQIEFQGIPVTLIDTAGIRRRGKIEKGVEEYSVIRSLKSIERADVSLLMIDATTGITAAGRPHCGIHQR